MGNTFKGGKDHPHKKAKTLVGNTLEGKRPRLWLRKTKESLKMEKDTIDPNNLTPEQQAMVDRSLLVRFSAMELIDLLSSLKVLNISHNDPAVNALEAKIKHCLGELSAEDVPNKKQS